MSLAKQAEVGPVPIIAAVSLVAAGGANALLASQYLAYYWLDGAEQAVIVTLLVLGSLAIGAGAMVGKARAWAAMSGAALSLLLGGLSTGFTVYAATNASFAFYSLFAPPTSALALLLSLVAVPFCLQTERARAELARRVGPGFGLRA